MSTTTPKIGEKFTAATNGGKFTLVRVPPTWEGEATPFWIDGIAAVHAADFNPPTKKVLALRLPPQAR